MTDLILTFTADEWEEALLLEQYEAIRMAGPCNMWDQACVRDHADELDFGLLVNAIDDGRYTDIIKGYSALMERYG